MQIGRNGGESSMVATPNGTSQKEKKSNRGITFSYFFKIFHVIARFKVYLFN